jgi:hypothetical protein
MTPAKEEDSASEPKMLLPAAEVREHGYDRSILRSRAGIRAVSWSLGILTVTALAQAFIYSRTLSVALLADLIHNFGDALTAIPPGLASCSKNGTNIPRHTEHQARAEDPYATHNARADVRTYLDQSHALHDWKPHRACAPAPEILTDAAISPYLGLAISTDRSCRRTTGIVVAAPARSRSRRR